MRNFSDIVTSVLDSMPTEEEAARRIVAAEAKDRADNERRRMDAWRQFAGPRYAGCRFENFEVPTDNLRTARDACREYAEALTRGNGQTNLVIVGPVGAGKDHLAIAVDRLAFDAGLEWDNDHKRRYGSRTFARISGVELFASWRDAMKAGTEVELRDTLTRPDLLIVSDPAGAADRLTEFQAATLLAIVDRRYEALRPMVVTINVADLAGLYALLTPPVADRLLHDARIVVVNAKSWRTAERS